MNQFFLYFLFFLLGAGGVGAAFLVHRIASRKLLRRALTMRLLRIKIPQETALSGNSDQRPADFKTEINRTEQLLNILSNLETPSVLEAAVHHTGEQIHFYAAVADRHVDFTIREIHGLWPHAVVEEAEDYNIFNPQGVATGAFLKSEESSMLPLRTYQEIESDTFETILSTFSKLEKTGEGAAIQIIIKKAPKKAYTNIHSAIKKLRQGKSASEVMYAGAGTYVKEAFSLATVKKNDGEKEPKPIDDATIELLEKKISKPLLYANIRLVASAPDIDRARSLLTNVAGSFSQFHAPRRNNLKVVIPKNPKQLLFQYSFRTFFKKHRIVLNSEELAGLYHFPGTTTEVPRINWLKTKEASPPDNLPHEGLMIGESLYRGERKPVRIADNDRRRHLYVIGQTGTGKSNALSDMAHQDVVNGKGLAIVDPHGDLVHDILSLVPPERADDVVVFDPGDIERPIAMNMLEYDPSRPEEKTFIVNEMQAIFNRLFPPETMGPMFEQYMRNALLLLMEDREDPGTLMEVPRVFTDAAWRNAKLERATNPAVIDFWQKEASKTTGEHSIANMAPYITSKFNNFIANDYVRPIIAQKRSAFRFRQVMDEGKILLVNLSKGRIGELNAGLLGMVVVGKLLMAALSRVDIPQDQRRDFYLYVDEFQNFTTDSIAVILSEARKYRLSLTLAHQFIGQLTDDIRNSVFGNVGSMVTFRVGAPDAEVLAKQFEPVFSQSDLINIDNFHAYAKILINNETSKPFNMRLPKAPEGDPERAEKLRQISRLRYGQPREEIERDIMQRLREL